MQSESKGASQKLLREALCTNEGAGAFRFFTQQHSWYVNVFEPEGDPWNVVWCGVSLVCKGELMICCSEPAKLQLAWSPRDL